VRVWPETPEERPHGVHHCDTIDRQASATQRPTCSGQWLLLDAPECNAPDGDEIGGHESDRGKRKHSIEGDAASNIDQGHDKTEAYSENDRVHWNVPLGMYLEICEPRSYVMNLFWFTYLSEPGAEGQAIVSRKSEGLTRGGSHCSDCDHHDEQQHDNGQSRRTSHTAGCLLEDIDEWEAGGV